VALTGPGEPLACGWCAALAGPGCASCGSTGLRALVTGASRTAEELGHAFPGVQIRTSSGSGVLVSVPASPAIVIATPGAEPRADNGYAAAILLDSWALLGRPGLRAAEEALRRWMNAAALVRPRHQGGTVVMVADPALPVVQALVRWDAARFADRELAERAELRFPPAVRMAALTGPADVIGDMLLQISLPDGADILGPVPAEMSRPGSHAEPAAAAGTASAPVVRFLVRAPWQHGTALAVALRGGMAQRSARKEEGLVRLQLDPAELI